MARYARCSDAWSATQAILGRELYDGQRLAGDAARTLLTKNGFPVPINNRVAYGLVALAWGGSRSHSVREYALSAANFLRYSEETFDRWSPFGPHKGDAPAPA